MPAGAADWPRPGVCDPLSSSAAACHCVSWARVRLLWRQGRAQQHPAPAWPAWHLPGATAVQKQQQQFVEMLVAIVHSQDVKPSPLSPLGMIDLLILLLPAAQILQPVL